MQGVVALRHKGCGTGRHCGLRPATCRLRPAGQAPAAQPTAGSSLRCGPLPGIHAFFANPAQFKKFMVDFCQLFLSIVSEAQQGNPQDSTPPKAVFCV